MIKILESNEDNIYYWNGTDKVPKDVVNVVIEDGIEEIKDRAFADCTSLTSVTIPDSVTKIREFAFDGCTSLKSIVIPASVTSIGRFIFENCTSLTDVKIYAEILKDPEIYKDAFRNTPVESKLNSKKKAKKKKNQEISIDTVIFEDETDLTIYDPRFDIDENKIPDYLESGREFCIYNGYVDLNDRSRLEWQLNEIWSFDDDDEDEESIDDLLDRVKTDKGYNIGSITGFEGFYISNEKNYRIEGNTLYIG